MRIQAAILGARSAMVESINVNLLQSKKELELRCYRNLSSLKLSFFIREHLGVASH